MRHWAEHSPAPPLVLVLLRLGAVPASAHTHHSLAAVLNLCELLYTASERRAAQPSPAGPVPPQQNINRPGTATRQHPTLGLLLLLPMLLMVEVYCPLGAGVKNCSSGYSVVDCTENG